jgi:RNA polymerase sigma-70 factor, ECF subfamily
MEDTDAALVQRARQGDSEAFEALVRRHLRAAYAVALARVGEPTDAEDACQDAFVTALERIEECRDPDRFGAWLLTIVRHRALDQRRRQAVRRALPLTAVAERAGEEDPHRDAERRQLHGRLLGALSGLTELQREVLLLFDFEGWTHQEIARRLGISSGSARVHLHTARRRVRQSWAEGEGERS